MARAALRASGAAIVDAQRAMPRPIRLICFCSADYFTFTLMRFFFFFSLVYAMLKFAIDDMFADARFHIALCYFPLPRCRALLYYHYAPALRERAVALLRHELMMSVLCRARYAMSATPSAP